MEEKGEKRWIKDDEARLEDEHTGSRKRQRGPGSGSQERPRCLLLPSLTFPSPTIPQQPFALASAFLSSLSAFNYFASRRGEQRVRLAIHSTSCFVSTLDEGSLVKTFFFFFFLNVGVSSLPPFFFLFSKKRNLPNIFPIIISPYVFNTNLSDFERDIIEIYLLLFVWKGTRRSLVEIFEFC